MTVYIDGLNHFSPHNGIGELMVPDNWTPIWAHDPVEGVLDRPEYKPAGVDQTRTPDGAAAIHSSFGTIDGVLVRTFNVTPGEAVAASVWMMKELPEGGHAMAIGIDPNGDSVFGSDRVVWSRWYSMYSTEDWAPGVWRERRVETVATSNLITVFLRSRVDIPVQSHAHFDDFTLTTSGIVPPEPPDGTLGELIGNIEDAVSALSDYVADSQVVQTVLMVE